MQAVGGVEGHQIRHSSGSLSECRSVAPVGVPLAAVIVEPTAPHRSLLRELLAAVGTGGNLVDGAYLAAPAIEHRAQIVSQDNDFLRFPGITLETTPEHRPPVTTDGVESMTRGLS